MQKYSINDIQLLTTQIFFMTKSRFFLAESSKMY